MTHVTKRDGTTELLDIDKITKSLEWASKDLNVSVSDVQIQSKLNFYNNIKTEEIHDVLIKTTRDMITSRTLDYDTMCMRLIMQKLYKEVFNGINPLHIKEVFNTNIKNGKYTEKLVSDFTDEEIEELNNYIDHSKDFTFTSAGIDQLMDKYMIFNEGKSIETPQIMFMAIAMDSFRDYPTDRMFYIKSLYTLLSNYKVTHPTPEMKSLRTTSSDYASCITIKIGDSIDSWNEGSSAIVNHTVSSAGIGVDISSIASIGDIVKNGSIVHGGKIPEMRSIDSDINKSTQNGRRGQAVTYTAFFDPEIEVILSLKSPRTEVTKRINDLKHAIKFHQLAYDRAKQNKVISLFSPRKHPQLIELLSDKDPNNFVKEYERLEREAEPDGEISARELMELFATERFENGIYYPFNADEANANSSYDLPVYQSNICMEFLSPTKDISSKRQDSPDIGVCILTNLNQAEVSLNEMEHVTDVIVRMQNNIMKRQVHPTPQANAFVRDYASIGIGLSNHAYYLAKQNLRYGQKEAMELHDEWMEYFQYYLIKASVNVAKEFGPARRFKDSSYSRGIMPIDRYKKTVDEIVQRKLSLDWEYLRKEVIKHGMANCALSMVPPSETSSVTASQTSSIEPIKDIITVKSYKTIYITQIAPEALKLADKYDYSYSRDITPDFIKHLAVTQKWIDMGISGNTFYNPELYKDNKVPLKRILEDLYLAKYFGLKTLYYNNTKPEDDDVSLLEQSGCSGDGCAV